MLEPGEKMDKAKKQLITDGSRYIRPYNCGNSRSLVCKIGNDRFWFFIDHNNKLYSMSVNIINKNDFSDYLSVLEGRFGKGRIADGQYYSGYEWSTNGLVTLSEFAMGPPSMYYINYHMQQDFYRHIITNNTDR
jgi:hypothetical protein